MVWTARQHVQLHYKDDMLRMLCRYLDNMTSERVDAEGIRNIAEAARQFLPGRKQSPKVETVLKMGKDSELDAWEKLDDVIMGGKSGSYLETAERVEIFEGNNAPKGSYDYDGAVWRGELIVEGGGFCGSRTKVSQFTCRSQQSHFYAQCNVLIIPHSFVWPVQSDCTT